MVEDIQPYGVLHLGIDNYFRLATPVTNTNAAFPTDFTAPTIGFLPRLVIGGEDDLAVLKRSILADDREKGVIESCHEADILGLSIAGDQCSVIPNVRTRC